MKAASRPPPPPRKTPNSAQTPRSLRKVSAKVDTGLSPKPPKQYPHRRLVRKAPQQPDRVESHRYANGKSPLIKVKDGTSRRIIRLVTQGRPRKGSLKSTSKDKLQILKQQNHFLRKLRSQSAQRLQMAQNTLQSETVLYAKQQLQLRRTIQSLEQQVEQNKQRQIYGYRPPPRPPKYNVSSMRSL